MPTNLKPSKLDIRAYQVGFGDCFLLTFHYPKARRTADRKRHVLIDFGSTELPDEVPRDQMLRVARDIQEQCGGEKNGKLHVVVATHRHKDHISGFATDGDATGVIIRNLKPDVVIQPWTEQPDAKQDATKLRGLDAPDSHQAFAKQAKASFVSALADMHTVADTVLSEMTHLGDTGKFKQGLSAATARQIRFIGDDNKLPNLSAVRNLAEMGKQSHYVNYGYNLNLAALLPGIKVQVLGPPTLEQYAKIKSQRSADKDEFWMLQAASKGFWGLQAATGAAIKARTEGKDRLFPDAPFYKDTVPAHNRWFMRQMRTARGEQLLGLVRILDKVMNNTSVILLFEAGGKKFLFPGDAQIENWEYALSQKKDLKNLKDVYLYKVGHHGSRNATPKTLWENFANKRDSKHAADPHRLETIVSTMKDKHGHEDKNTEVPRRTLVTALNKLSNYHTTEQAALYNEVTIPLDDSNTVASAKLK